MEDIEYIFKEINYLAVYDPETCCVTKVGPEHSLKNEKYKLLINKNLAIDIIGGIVQLSRCFVDLDSESLELTERQHIVKIDDVLHRISEKKWSKNKNSEIFLTYNKNKEYFSIQLTSTLGGNKKVNKSSSRKIFWSGDTEMIFYFTEYNDPHKLINIISITINDLIKKTFEQKNFKLPEKFSVYTRRLFKGYVLEIK